MPPPGISLSIKEGFGPPWGPRSRKVNSISKEAKPLGLAHRMLYVSLINLIK